MKIAWVSGDDVTALVEEGSFGSIKHLDLKGVELSATKDNILAANVYTGKSGIVCPRSRRGRSYLWKMLRCFARDGLGLLVA